MNAVVNENVGSLEGVSQGAISIKDVVKVYDPDGAAVMAVDHCSIDIPAGEIVGLVGQHR